MKNQKIEKILIFGLCGMGDLIMLTPTLRSFKKNLPNCKITIVVRSHIPKEVLRNPFVDEVINYPSDFIINIWTKWFKMGNKLRNLKNLTQEIFFLLRLRKRKFDFSMWAFPGETKRGALISFLAGARIRMGPFYQLRGKKSGFLYKDTIDFFTQRHAVGDNLQYLKKLGLKKTDKKLALSLSANDLEFAEGFFKKNNLAKKDFLVGIHPGCDKANAHRRWPLENFVSLAKSLNKDSKVIVFEGPDEEGMLENFKTMKILKGKNLSFGNLAAIIKRCNVMITTDSGLGHIAAATNVPTITLFGPANPNKTRPFGNKGIVLDKLDPSVYLNNDFVRMKAEGRDALEKITVEEVLEAYKKLRKRKRNT